MAKTADQECLKGYSIPQNIILSISTGGTWLGGDNPCWGQAGHQSVDGEQWYLASLVILGVLFLSLFVTAFLLQLQYFLYFALFWFLNCSYLNPQILLYSSSLPHPTGVRGLKMSEHLDSTWLLAGVKPQQ